MKNTLIILSIALLPTLAQAEKALDKQVEVIAVSEAKPAQTEQTSQNLSLTIIDSKKESSASIAEADSSKQDK